MKGGENYKMSNTTISQSELASHTPTILLDSATKGLGYLRKYLNLARTVDRNYKNEFGKLGKTLQISKRGSLVAYDKTQKSSVTKQAPSDDSVNLVLNKHKEVTFPIEDVAEAVAIPDTMNGYISDAVAVLAEAVEQAIADEYANAGTTLQYSSFSSWPQVLRRARRTLILAKYPKLAPMFAQLDPYAVETILNTTGIESADKFGNNRPLVDANIEKLSGIGLFESQITGLDTTTSPDTYYPMVYGPSAITLAVRPLPDWGNGRGVEQMTVFDEESGLALRSTLGYDKDNLELQVTLDILFGVKTVRPEHVIAIAHQPSVDS